MDITIGGALVETTDEVPQEEGKFLYVSDCGAIDVITLYLTDKRFDYGIEWDAYYGVVEYRGRNVKQLTGSFAKINKQGT